MSSRTPARGARGDSAAAAAEDREGRAQAPARFGLLLLVLVFSYLMSAFFNGPWVSALQIVLFVGVVALSVRAGRLGRGITRMAIMLVAGGSAIAITLALTHSADAGAGVANLWKALILLFAVALIVRQVLAAPAVTFQSILGAVSAYMIIGLMFAAVYGATYRFAGNTFFANGSPGNLQTFQYFSFTTLTTLGYGDFTAASSGGRAVAVMEALFGQVFLATLVARLVSAFRAPSRTPASAGRRGGRGRGSARGGFAGRVGRHGAGSFAGRPAQSPRRLRRAGPLPRAATGTSSRARARPARRSRAHPGQ